MRLLERIQFARLKDVYAQRLADLVEASGEVEEARAHLWAARDRLRLAREKFRACVPLGEFEAGVSVPSRKAGGKS